jgi:hypothetical protein
MGEKRLGVFQEMTTFVHHLDRSGDLRNPVQCEGERFGMEAEGGYTQHLKSVYGHRGINVLIRNFGRESVMEGKIETG